MVRLLPVISQNLDPGSLLGWDANINLSYLLVDAMCDVQKNFKFLTFFCPSVYTTLGKKIFTLYFFTLLLGASV